MAKEQFRDFNFRKSTLTMIARANSIILDYHRAGLKLTLRQLYYQFVARGLIPNTDKSYNALGVAVNNGRLAGLIDWDAIEDRTRNLESVATWDTPSDIIRSAARSYREDLWRNQRYRVEVWVEKEALAGVIEQACDEKRLPFLSCRGYLSQSEAYAAGKRMARYRRNGQTPVVLHLGDHDPSGIDMSRDNEARLEEFSRGRIIFKRLALNWDQIQTYNPPPNPAKMTDSRFNEYYQNYGDESWELDALEPTVLINLINDAVTNYIDPEAWGNDEAKEEENQERLEGAEEHWPEVAHYLKYREYNHPYAHSTLAEYLGEIVDDQENNSEE